MATYSINLTKRENGGFTVVTESATYYPSDVVYHGTSVGVVLYSRGVTTNLYKPAEWTIQTVTGFTTVIQVCDALDALGITSGDPLQDMKALLTTIGADTGNISIVLTNLEKGAGQVTLGVQRIVLAKADYVDTTDGTVIYEGYNNDTNFSICKTTIDGSEITREWADGDWGDRESLFES